MKKSLYTIGIEMDEKAVDFKIAYKGVTILKGNTNSEGEGRWNNGKQEEGTAQFELKGSRRQIYNKLYRIAQGEALAGKRYEVDFLQEYGSDFAGEQDDLRTIREWEVSQ